MHDLTKRIGLGTVQFGMDYGISNTAGKVPPQRVATILAQAHQSGVSLLDTASAYGDSEQCLGQTIHLADQAFRIVSKLPPNLPPQDVETELKKSLKRLQQPRLWGILAHRFSDYQNNQVVESLLKLKNQGWVEKIGVSVYEPEELDWLWHHQVPFDLVQLPFNVLDQRFKPILPRLKQYGVEVHTRSTFLQGLLFLEPEQTSKFFAPVHSQLNQIHQLAQKLSIKVSELLLNYVLSHPEIDKVIIGVISPDQLVENLNGLRSYPTCLQAVEELNSLATFEESIINPSLWK